MENFEMFQIVNAMKDKKRDIFRDRISKLIDEKETTPLEKAGEGLKLLAESIRAEACTLWVYDSIDTGYIYPKAFYGGAEISGVKLKPGEGIAGQVIKNNEAVMISDCKKDPRWLVRVDNKSGFITRTMICIPVTLYGSPFGCIQVINTTTGELFDEKDLELAKCFAEEVSAKLDSTSKETLKGLGLFASNWNEDQTVADVLAVGTSAEAVDAIKKQPLYGALGFLGKLIVRLNTSVVWFVFHLKDK